MVKCSLEIKSMINYILVLIYLFVLNRRRIKKSCLKTCPRIIIHRDQAIPSIHFPDSCKIINILCTPPNFFLILCSYYKKNSLLHLLRLFPTLARQLTSPYFSLILFIHALKTT